MWVCGKVWLGTWSQPRKLSDPLNWRRRSLSAPSSVSEIKHTATKFAFVKSCGLMRLLGHIGERKKM